mgnify:FL=1
MADMSLLLRSIADHLRRGENAFLAGRAAEARSHLQSAAASLAAASTCDDANSQIRDLVGRMNHLEGELSIRPSRPLREKPVPEVESPPSPDQFPAAE